MRTFGTGGRLAELEARLAAEMRAASAEGWILTEAAGLGDSVTRCCCALGAVVRDVLAFPPEHGSIVEVVRRLALADEQYGDIAAGFDGETFDPDTNEYVHLGRRLRVLADQLNLERVRRAGAST